MKAMELAESFGIQRDHSDLSEQPVNVAIHANEVNPPTTPPPELPLLPFSPTTVSSAPPLLFAGFPRL